MSNKPQRLKDFTDLVEINIVGTFNAIRMAVPLLAENPPNEAGLFVFSQFVPKYFIYLIL